MAPLFCSSATTFAMVESQGGVAVCVRWRKLLSAVIIPLDEPHAWAGGGQLAAGRVQQDVHFLRKLVDHV